MTPNPKYCSALWLCSLSKHQDGPDCLWHYSHFISTMHLSLSLLESWQLFSHMLLSVHTVSQVFQMFSSLLMASGTHIHTHFSCFPQNIPNMVNRFNSLQVITFFSFSPVDDFLIHCYILTYFYELIPDITLEFCSSFSILPFKVHQYLLHSLRIQPILCISPYPPAVFSFSSLLCLCSPKPG